MGTSSWLGHLSGPRPGCTTHSLGLHSAPRAWGESGVCQVMAYPETQRREGREREQDNKTQNEGDMKPAMSRELEGALTPDLTPIIISVTVGKLPNLS